MFSINKFFFFLHADLPPFNKFVFHKSFPFHLNQKSQVSGIVGFAFESLFFPNFFQREMLF